jgi:CRISPR/Cas system-associated protein Cas5 (RAMP superfamily)
MLTDKEIAIYALGKTEGVHSIAETLGKGLEDEKYIESWNKTMKLLGIEMPLKDLEKIYNEFATKMDELVESENIKPKKSDKNRLRPKAPNSNKERTNY